MQAVRLEAVRGEERQCLQGILILSSRDDSAVPTGRSDGMTIQWATGEWDATFQAKVQWGASPSTLTNTLAGDSVMNTQPVRAFDDKGRHTTTRRQMIKLIKDRGLLIDSPGVREMQIYYDTETLSRVFTRIEEASMHCKYSNCQHDSEGDCAVKSRAREDAEFRLKFEKYRTVKRMAVAPITDY